MKKTYTIPVTWELYGTVEVEAESLGEALEIVRIDEDDMPLPEGNYVDGSFKLSTEEEDEIIAITGVPK